MVNTEISEIFRNMALYLEMQEDQKAFFRARAFKKAADTIDSLTVDLSSNEYKELDNLKEIDGIGDRIASHIIEYVKTGNIPEYEDLKSKSPVNLEELKRVQGVGPKKILKLYNELGITDLESLKKAALDNKIADLEGFGKKSQDAILDSINFAIENKSRVLISVADEEAEGLLAYMDKDKHLLKISYAGSLRRRKETIGDLDFLAASNDPQKTFEYFTSYPRVEKILSKGETKSSIWLKSKIQIDMRIVDNDTFGAAMQYFTGSKEHNVKLRNIAISKGYKLSEYGLFARPEGLRAIVGAKPDKKAKEVAKELENEGRLIAGENEREIYKILGLEYIEPELRENTIEFELAAKNKLPKLIDIADVKGDLHMHTTWSDGQNSVKEMAESAKKLHYHYIGITDHFGKLAIANAIDPSRFDKYLKDIKSTKIDGIKIYAGCEVDIAKDGELEFDQNLLKKLDYVIASVHLNTKMDSQSMTKRLIKVLKNPVVKILGHPTGRLIGQRPGYEFDYKEVFKVAKEEGVALEINAHPMRLDLRDIHVKLAIDIGCKISINTDSHIIKELNYMKYGVYNARRGFVEPHNLFVLH